MNAGLDLRANEPVKLTTTPVRQAWRYWLALGAVMAAAVARLAMGPLLGNGLPFLAFYPAVAIAAMVAGWQAGIAATFISALIADCFFIVPRQNLLPGDTAGLVSLLIFVAAGLTISGTAALLSWARGRERHAAAILSADLDTMSRLQKIGALFVSGGN